MARTALLIWLFFPQIAIAQPVVSSPPRLVIEASTAAQRQLADLSEAVRLSQWERVAEIAERIYDGEPVLVEVRPGAYRDVSGEVDRVLLSLPSEVWTRLGRRISSGETVWREISERALLSAEEEDRGDAFLTRYKYSQHAPLVCWKLAEAAWRRGDAETCRRSLRPLIAEDQPPGENSPALESWRFLDLPAPLRTRSVELWTQLSRMTSSDQPRADLLFGGVAWRTSALRSTTSLVVENQVVIVGAQSIRVLQIGTGVPAWPADLPQDNGTIVSLESDAGDTSAVELSAPVIHQGRVLTCLRDPEDEGNPGGYRERLVCSDLTCGEGRTLWTRTLNELAGEGDLRLVSEAIAIPGGYCVCLERRTPPHRLRIICIRPLNGDVRWECPLGTRLYAGPSANSPQPAVPRVSLNYAGGRIFMETGTDAAVCLDRLGRLKWATVAPSVSSASRVTRASTKSRLLVDEGRVLLLGADGHAVRCLAAETGEVLWNQPLAGTAVGIARCGDRVIISGSGLRGLEFRSGRFIWQLGSETEDDPHPAVVSGQDLLWPHESELWHVNASEGRILNRIPLTRWDLDVLTDFCLSLPTGRLLFTTPTEITAVRCGLRDGF